MKRLTILALALLGACKTSPPAAPRIVADPSLGRQLEAEGVSGCVVLFAEAEGTMRGSDVDECTRRSTPASTFKIANSIIALETGVAPDETLVIPWDHVSREFESWNDDLDMRQAFAASSVPYYQEVARRIGLARMATWVERLGYGNAEVGTGVDTFWLRGPLAISPIEQLAFLRRFEEGRLPIASRTRSIVRSVMSRERRGEAELFGKTGWERPRERDEHGWFVGYATRGDDVAYVAVRIVRTTDMPDERFLEARLRVARAALESIGAF